MAGKFVMPKGRQTIRKSGGAIGGRDNRRTRLWEFEAAPGTTMAKLESAYLASFNEVDAVAERKASAAASGKFTPQGVAEDALQFALNNTVPTFARGRAAIKAAKAEAAARREKIKLREPDNSDLWKVNLRVMALQRVAAMSAEERNHFITENIDLIDPIVAEAIVTAPSWLSGVSDSHRNLLTDKALTAQHGAEMAELQELERGIVVAESTVETGRDEVRLETGVFDPHQFDRLAAPIENKTAAHWLKKFTDNGVEVVRKMSWDATKSTGSWTVATPTEIENGVFYESADDYRKATNPMAA
jgi:hypothetical protein